MVISIRRALLTHGGWPFGETVRKETRLKNTTLSHKKGRTNTRYPTN